MLQVSKRATFFGHTCQSCSFLEENTEKRLSSVKLADLFTCGWRLRGVGILVGLLEEINYLHRFSLILVVVRSFLKGKRTRLKGRMISFLYFILPALGGYTLTSVYLLKNPLILHKRKRTVFYGKHISHRGGKVVCMDQFTKIKVSRRTGNVIPKCIMCCREESLILSLDPETSGKVS